MGDISKNFDRSEFACKCGCGYNTVDTELIDVIQDVRDHFTKMYPDRVVRIHINSGCRCPEHNRSGPIKGGKKSQHLYGKAGDIVPEGFTVPELYDYLDTKYPDKYGIGVYTGRIHVDVRSSEYSEQYNPAPGRKRWVG
jgi:uncharacterized protein YcbK (DUF882 family)